MNQTHNYNQYTYTPDSHESIRVRTIYASADFVLMVAANTLDAVQAHAEIESPVPYEPIVETPVVTQANDLQSARDLVADTLRFAEMEYSDVA